MEQQSNVQTQTQQTASWEEWQILCKVEVDRLYLLGGRTPPDDKTLEYLAKEAAMLWKRIGPNRIHKAVSEAIIYESPQSPNIGSVIRVFSIKHEVN